MAKLKRSFRALPEGGWINEPRDCACPCSLHAAGTEDIDIPAPAVIAILTDAVCAENWRENEALKKQKMRRWKRPTMRWRNADWNEHTKP